ncbi:carboxypeptidase-like regulatory domain-containing protein [Pedobacter ureilyticus]|uniref:Carboxypeptidase-like regulatory domain-containing protein n=1 Tax=Pedobacter ureilyticus TaxID=1393051 RepID=A0ABW9J986_9SPHI|nr:carboxypeptidase-like regulatory domain-containing protein [Pedobacter helvus]
MRKYFLFFLLIFGTIAHAQIIQGKVVDEISGEPIPFVSIGVIGTNNSTVTNDAGEFVLKNIILPAKLRYSHVSYLLLESEISTANNLYVKLKAAAINLKTVTIDPYRGERLVKAALEKTKEFEKENFYGKAFYRQLTTIDGKAKQIYELFYDLKFNVSNVEGWIAKQSRFAESNEGISFSMSNQSYLTFLLAGSLFEGRKMGKYVSLKTLKDFEITVERYIEQKEQDVAVVSCKYKGKKKDFYTNFTYYIGVDDSKIYRLESSAFNLPLKVNATSKMPPNVTTVATFNGANTPIPVLESISTKLFLHLSTRNRSISPVINSMLTVYQLDKNLNTQNFTELNKKIQDKTVVESIAYNPDFWKNNPIVKQTALEDAFIKMMESKSAFGTMIDTQ